VLFATGRVVFTGLGHAGFGSRLLDVAAFLATCGADASGRRALAERYARARGLDAQPAADAIDAATTWWGLHELLQLPRRQIEALGDDAATEALKLSAARIDRALREPAGSSPAAAALRAALWSA
jgi:hypothetical protein